MEYLSVLLSIKPKYVEKILNGEKHYEYRKKKFNKSIEQVYIYASSPIKKVVGEFKIDRILSLDLEELWAKTNSSAGIDKSFFDQYFQNSIVGYAIKIKDPVRYSSYLDLENFGVNFAPQSFRYVNTLERKI